jgi:hypothetical protein
MPPKSAAPYHIITRADIPRQLYKGSDEILLSKLILDPTHSILKQSFDSRLRLVSTILRPAHRTQSLTQ